MKKKIEVINKLHEKLALRNKQLMVVNKEFNDNYNKYKIGFKQNWIKMDSETEEVIRKVLSSRLQNKILKIEKQLGKLVK